MKLGGLIQGVFRPFVDFVFPATCLSCNALLSETEIHLCRPCWSSIPRLDTQHPLFLQTHMNLVDSGMIQDLVSVFVFEKRGSLQSLAHAMKYDGFASVGRLLGRELGSQIVIRKLKADCLVPVPLHPIKMRERGFNQAETIANGISERTGIPVRNDLLLRIRYTQTQTRLAMEQRQKNVDHAFATRERFADGGVCILVDDVITTGATIISCGEALQAAGFRIVIAASSALAQ